MQCTANYDLIPIIFYVQCTVLCHGCGNFFCYNLIHKLYIIIIMYMTLFIVYCQLKTILDQTSLFSRNLTHPPKIRYLHVEMLRTT